MVKTKAQQIMADREARSEQEATRAILDIAAEFEPYIIRQRRHFHKHPEPSLEEVRTTSDIAGQLDAMNIPYERPLKTGLVATLRGTAPDAYRADGTPRRRLLMRADIDALPVTERTEEEFASVNEGYMHACGHDCHIAMMLGCLQVLRHMTDDIHGEVRVVFQPSEENGSGAKMMCEAGVCEDVDGAFAMHIWSEVDAGTVSCEPGPRMANTDWFRIDVHGTSCHGAMPQRGADAIMVAAEIVNALQTIVSRDLSPYEPAVVTVGELHGGTARNVIAGSAYLTGTVRTYSDATHEMMPELIRRICTHTAAALGAEAELSDYTIANYKVENEPAASERCRQAVLKVLGAAGEGATAERSRARTSRSTSAACPACSPSWGAATRRWAPRSRSIPATTGSTSRSSPRSRRRRAVRRRLLGGAHAGGARRAARRAHRRIQPGARRHRALRPGGDRRGASRPERRPRGAHDRRPRAAPRPREVRG